jgi:ferritin
MIGDRVEAALNEQITQEFYASQSYLSMSAHFETTGFAGFARWMRIQADEERTHALRIFDFVNDRDGRVTLGTINAPPSNFASPLEVFEAALAHERKVSAMIGELYRLSMEEADYPTQVMLQWFVNEQVEEEKTARHAIASLDMVSGRSDALLLLDREMAARVPSPRAA